MIPQKIVLSKNHGAADKQIELFEKQVQTKCQINFSKRILPKVSDRLLFFQRNKPKITFTTQFRSMNNNNDIVSQSEIILMKRDYEFLHTEPNDMINPIPRIKNSLKVHKRNKNNDENKAKFNPASSEVISYIETNPFYIHRMPNQNKIGTTLYAVLTKKKQQFFDQLSQSKDSGPILPQMTTESKKREHCIKMNHSNTNYSDMNKKDAIPIVNPIACLNDATYLNISERERYQRLSEELLKEKELINRKPKFCHKILQEFLLRNGIYEEEYYKNSYLTNLNEYLHSDIVIRSDKTLRDHIIHGLDYKINKAGKISKDDGNENRQYSIRKTIKKRNLFDENHQCSSNIRTDMELQRNLYENKLMQTQIDFVKSPKRIVDLLKDDFLDEEQQSLQPLQSKEVTRPKTESLFHPNKRLYATQIHKNDFNQVKKDNKILEYICYVKAKKLIQFKEIKNKLMIEDLKEHTPIHLQK